MKSIVQTIKESIITESNIKWSKYDEECLDNAIHCLKREGFDSTVEWLESLRTRKPNEKWTTHDNECFLNTKWYLKRGEWDETLNWFLWFMDKNFPNR